MAVIPDIHEEILIQKLRTNYLTSKIIDKVKDENNDIVLSLNENKNTIILQKYEYFDKNNKNNNENNNENENEYLKENIYEIIV